MINRPSLPILHFEQCQLLVGAAARRSNEDAHVMFVQFSVQKIKQVSSLDVINTNRPVFRRPTFSGRSITGIADLNSDHTLGTEPLSQ